MRHSTTLYSPQQAHTEFRALEVFARPWLIAGHRLMAIIQSETRSTAQNNAQWPYLEAFSQQLLWPVNGEMVRMEAEDWKDVLTAAFRRETVRVAMGLNGGVVMLGVRTSKMLKPEFSEWLEFLKATAADRGVTVYEDEAA